MELLVFIVLICIYLSALVNVISPVDGLLYLFMLTFFVILAYSKKLGPLLSTTIFALLVKLFELTHMFWFAIPWWGYLVLIGCILIVFSMHNEKVNQNNKKSLKEKMKNIKEYLDI